MFDIGVNLLHSQFEGDRDAVLARARRAGVARMLVTATDLVVTERAIAYCRARDMICTAGVHPHDAKDAPDDLRQRLCELASAPCVRAIGEIGLDFNRNFSNADVQQRVFEVQLQVAAEVGLPVFVHDRDTDGAVHAALARHAGGLHAIVSHCFTGTRADLERLLALGCYVGITGWVCDTRRGGPLRELIPEIPLDHLLIETDAPFLRPHNAPANALELPSALELASAPEQAQVRPEVTAPARRNEPALLPYVAEVIAELRGMAPAELGAVTAANAARLFGDSEVG